MNQDGIDTSIVTFLQVYTLFLKDIIKRLERLMHNAGVPLISLIFGTSFKTLISWPPLVVFTCSLFQFYVGEQRQNCSQI